MLSEYPHREIHVNRFNFALLAVAVSILALEVAPAMADDVSAARRREASVRYERGLKFSKAGEHEKALVEFKATYRLARHHSVLRNIAVTQKRLFRYREALDSIERSLKEGKGKMSREDHKKVKDERDAIRALMGTVNIRVKPGGSAVSINGKAEGTSPQSVLLGPGQYIVRASKDGYEQGETSIEVSAGGKQEVRLELKSVAPNLGTLTIETKPTGAQLSIEENVVGISPWRGQLKPGGHRVRAVLPDYEPSEKEVVLAQGQTRAVTFTLQERIVEKPFYKKWYFWTGVVVVAAAGTATYFILTQDRPDAEITVDLSMPSLVRF